MPLIPADLQASFLKLYRKPPNRLQKVVQSYADAYTSYAAKATAGGIPPVFTGLEKEAMRSTLLPALQRPEAGNPATIANAWDQAVLAFWLANPAASLFPTATLVAYVPGPLTATLTALFSNVTNTAPQAANGQGTALDTATKTVAVTLPGPVIVTLL